MRKKWSKKEDKILHDYYIQKGSKFCQQYLFNRAIHSIQEHARQLGIKKQIFKKWTHQEIILLKNNYKTKGCKSCSSILKRNNNL